MGNLVLSAGEEPDMRKGIISLWFRIPAATAAAVDARVDPFASQYDPFIKVIPLVTWGSQVSQAHNDVSTEIVDYPVPSPCVGPAVPEPVQSIGSSTTGYAGPSYIGVRVESGVMTLEVNIQTDNHPTCVGTSSIAADYVWTIPSVGCDVPWPGCSEAETCLGIGYEPDFTDTSYLDAQMLEYFGNRPDVMSGGFLGWGCPYGQPVISGTDRWHHVILSWDVTPGASAVGWDSNADPAGATRGLTELGVGTVSYMWCAIDDVNKNGHNLPAMWPYYNAPANLNSMLSYTPAGVSSVAVAIDGSAGTASVGVSAVSFSPFHIPSDVSVTTTSAGVATPNVLVEMAELQVYAGISLDTGLEVSRRLFVTSLGKPEDPSVATAELGQSPIVMLRGQDNWINGVNTGTIGDLTPGGTITRYDINPGL